MNRMQVVNALREMFGLCFYTDEPGRTVYAEPRELFYRNDTVVDWSDRLDLSRPWKVSELAADVPGTLTWEYCSGDGASAAFNTANGGRLGRWSVQTGNPWRRSQERVYENPLFTTSVNLTGFVSSAPSASVVAAGDMDASSEGADDLNFPAKVVHYFGLRELPRESGGLARLRRVLSFRRISCAGVSLRHHRAGIALRRGVGLRAAGRVGCRTYALLRRPGRGGGAAPLVGRSGGGVRRRGAAGGLGAALAGRHRSTYPSELPDAGFPGPFQTVCRR